MAQRHIKLLEIPDYQQIKRNFLQELTLASQNKPSNLSFIKNKLSTKPLIKNGIVQGIVIGGTNYILSTEEINNDGTRKILKRKTGVLPVFDTKQTFVSFLSEHLDPRADAIGMNFGFKLKTTYGKDGSLDGTILAKGTKEHPFTGLTEPVGTLIKTIFTQKYQKEIPTSVANDTVCLLLSGNGNEYCSLIAGTGFNIGLRMKNAKQTVIINLEAGGFNQFDQSAVLKRIDAKTKNPGKKLFEKAVSGKYLAVYFNEKIKDLNLPISPLTTSQELSELSHANHTDVAGDLARAIIERSAFLVASAIAGVYDFCVIQRIVPRGSALAIIGEGSLLWNGWHYEQNVQKELIELGVPKDTVTIKQIPDSSINGAIGLVLS